MVNTLLSGFINIAISLINWFLTPIYNLLDNIDINGFTLQQGLVLVNDYLQQINSVLGWVADATGLPGWLFATLGAFMLVNISLRIAVYAIKLILKWYRKIMP